jgi:phospholipase/carboxylesterase
LTAELERYESALAPLVGATIDLLVASERVQRHLDPPRFDELRVALRPHLDAVAATLERLRAATPPDRLRGFHDCWLEGAGLAERSARLFVEPSSASMRGHPILDVLASMKSLARAQETLYAIHEFPPLSRYFVEPHFHSRLGTLDASRRKDLSVGLHHTGGKDGAGARGQLCLYVPESYDDCEEWPLVVALHGGSGSGREFLWAWLREARGRRFLLLAPTAQGPTWSLIGPDVDGAMLRAMVAWVSDRWRVKRSSVLLTGLSDGATFSLLTGLGEASPFTALAPIAGVLHPGNAANGNLSRAAGKRVYLVHGVRDWMFPVEIARVARDQLQAAGAELVYREIADLSHTYPREENARILEWFDPALSVPTQGAEM